MNDKINTETIEASVQPEDETKDSSFKADAPKNIWAIIVSVLLLTLVVFNIIQFSITSKQNRIQAERAATYMLRVEEAEDLLDRQQSAINNLMDDYEKVVYDNPRVTTITQQQFLATEFSLTTLQILAVQNTQIIQLLASMP